MKNIKEEKEQMMNNINTFVFKEIMLFESRTGLLPENMAIQLYSVYENYNIDSIKPREKKLEVVTSINYKI